MNRIRSIALLAAFGAASGVATLEAASPSLRGSPAAMREQNQVAKDHGLTFYRTGDEILDAVMRGELVELPGDANYEIADFVRFPYLHPVAALFVERLSAQYREACGQKLVVTSAVRPSSGQPRNAHALSVHPAGMAVDLRVSDRAACRAWLEGAIMNLEREGVLNGIRERNPPHYHVAIYPAAYAAYAAERAAAAPIAATVTPVDPEASPRSSDIQSVELAAAALLSTTETKRTGTWAGLVLLLLFVASPLGARLARARHIQGSSPLGP